MSRSLTVSANYAKSGFSSGNLRYEIKNERRRAVRTERRKGRGGTEVVPLPFFLLVQYQALRDIIVWITMEWHWPSLVVVLEKEEKEKRSSHRKKFKFRRRRRPTERVYVEEGHFVCPLPTIHPGSKKREGQFSITSSFLPASHVRD